MILKELFSDVQKEIYGSDNIEISDLCYDSRKALKGSLFFALAGTHTSGEKFIKDAEEKGAVCIVSEHKAENCSCTNVVIKDIVKTMAEISAKFYGYPDKKLTVIGVTGTNGKTSITYMTESLLKTAGIETAVFGTINYRYGDVKITAPNTTPQSADLYRMMADIVKKGIKHLIMEVSSHSLVLGRVHGIEFDVAVFTNLTRDHLDFHKDMEEYYNAKKQLFTGLKNNMKSSKKFAIINSDDEYGKKLLSCIDGSVVKIPYSVKDKTAECTAENISVTHSGTYFYLKSCFGNAEISATHIGLHNVYNILAALSVCFALNIDFNKAVSGIKNMAAAPGRLEPVKNSKGFSVVVDYAHTDDALKNVLATLKNLKHNRLITVFGCGGNRDKTKRPLMADAACSMSDIVVITSDNPREENPEEIIKDIVAGAVKAGKNNYTTITDRKDAIEYALKNAVKDDIILIAGKGHEDYQIIGREKIHFDDREVAAEVLKNLI